MAKVTPVAPTLDKDVLYRQLRRSAAWHTVDAQLRHPVHAYLLLGEDKLALEALCDLMCARVYCPTACGHCAECNKVLGRSKIDIAYPNQWGETLKRDVVQARIIEDALLGSFEGGKKIYVLQSFEMQSERVQNLLLKTLEEPHDNVMFLLLAASTAGILPTVLSRVKPIQLAPFAVDDLARMLQQMQVANAQVLARCSAGNLTMAWQMAGDAGYFARVDEVFDMLLHLDTLGQVCLYIFRPMFDKENILGTLQVMHTVYSDLLYWHAGLRDSLTYAHKAEAYAALGTRYALRCVDAVLALVEEAKLKIDSNCTAANVADSLLGGLLEVKQ